MPSNSNQFNVLSANLPALIIVVLLTAVVVWYFTTTYYGTHKSTFMNLSSEGYYYNITNLTFASKTDRDKGIQTLIRLFSEDGATYTPAQLASLSDSFILMILESEDDVELEALKARVVLLIDPTYKAVFIAVQNGTARQRLTNEADRQMVYDILVKYFNAKQNAIREPLTRWSDALLIKTFRTLRMPEATEYIYIQ